MKYEEGVKVTRSEEGNEDKLIKRSAIKGQSDLEIQVSKLNTAIAEAKHELDCREEDYKTSKFKVPFCLESIDDAEYKFKLAKKKVKSLEEDLLNRKKLLEELFG